VEDDLRTCGLALPKKPLQVFVRRLPQAYPIYQRGYERALEPLDRWIGDVENLLSYGRQGLFAHDNTHHALAMAYAAVDCLTATGFDRENWRAHREVFATHVVED
jgi:protoporphyrinogen oxidase